MNDNLHMNFFVEITFEFINSTRGGYLLVVQDYTFSRINKSCYIWKCSGKSINCKARVRMNASNRIVSYNLVHNHPPPTYYRTKSGEMVKLK